ncbi:MAG: protein kinase, partial [Candidatus Obscuribacterales bacterium]|nr:protein kinase [Candidatus Obscuribacterales bacterium]
MTDEEKNQNDKQADSSEDAGSNPQLFPENSLYDLEPIVIPEDLRLIPSEAESTDDTPPLPAPADFKHRISTAEAPPMPKPASSSPLTPVPSLGPASSSSKAPTSNSSPAQTSGSAPAHAPSATAKSADNKYNEESYSGEESIYELEPFILPGQELTLKPDEEAEEQEAIQNQHEESKADISNEAAEPISESFNPTESIYELEPFQTDQKLHSAAPAEETALQAPSESSSAGTLLSDRYELLGVIGEGAMAVVCKARQKSSNLLVAVKILKSTDDEHRARFIREIKTHSQLNHKNIVGYIESITSSDGRMFLVMERIKGVSLLEIIKKLGRLNDEENIASILVQILQALEHAHERRIIHRDLKSGNVIVMKESNNELTVKILDFGISKAQGEDQQRLTQEGQALVSPVYMSPEQCTGQLITTRCDLYSLGIVAYEMITGKPPYLRRSVINIMAAHCDESVKPDPIAIVAPEIGCLKLLEQIIFKALETDTNKRWQSASQFRSALEFWLEQVKAGNSEAELPPELLEVSEKIEITEVETDSNYDLPEVDRNQLDQLNAARVGLETVANHTSLAGLIAPGPVRVKDERHEIMASTQELQMKASRGKTEKENYTPEKTEKNKAPPGRSGLPILVSFLIGIAIGHFGTVHFDQLKTVFDTGKQSLTSLINSFAGARQQSPDKEYSKSNEDGGQTRSQASQEPETNSVSKSDSKKDSDSTTQSEEPLAETESADDTTRNAANDLPKPRVTNT